MSDDLNDDDLSLDGSFDEFEKKDKTLGDLFRENPLFKIGAIAGAAIIIFIAISFFSGGSDDVNPSLVGEAPDITATPGTEQASPAYVQAVEEANEAEIERAFNTGDSALPVPIDPPVGIVSIPEEREEAEDPLQRWRRLQEERLEREIINQQQAPVEPQVDTARQEAVAALSDAMAQQMSSILESKGEISLSRMDLTSPDFLKQRQQAAEEALVQAQEAQAAAGNETISETILPAGRIAYAQLITEANTDAPGPVLAQIMSGPLKGSRILGTFEEQNELLTLNFNVVVYKDESLTVNAVALDPETTLPGMATEVDHRYFKRIILPAAAAFVEGAASAISESGLTTVTVEGDTVAEETQETDTEQEIASGIEEAGEELGEILDQMADETEVLVRIESGTPIGILFLEPVVREIGDVGVNTNRNVNSDADIEQN